MTRIQLTLQIHNAIRREKNPPLGKYCLLLALASTGQPMTVHQIAKTLGEATYGSGTLDRALEHGLIQHTPGPTNSRHFTLTPKGQHQVQKLIAPELQVA
jgi:DNA-binding MarR family transcriptional regulator